MYFFSTCILVDSIIIPILTWVFLLVSPFIIMGPSCTTLNLHNACEADMSSLLLFPFLDEPESLSGCGAGLLI